jgi:hypothetical protein
MLTKHAVIALALVVPLQAETLYEWTFDEAAGTQLSETTNSGTFPGTWDADFERTATSGSGALIVRRSPDTTANAYVPIEPPAGQSLPDKFWVVVELGGWLFAGNLTTETMRVGIVNSPRDLNPFVYAQIRFGRNDYGQTYVLAESFGSNESITEEYTGFESAQNEKVTLVLEFDRSENRFALYSRFEEQPFVSIGEGSLSPERDAFHLRLGFSGHFAASSEFLSIERIALVTDNPVAK